MEHIDIDRLAGRLYTAQRAVRINLDYCSAYIESDLLTHAESTQLQRLRLQNWAAQGTVDPFLVWEEFPLDERGYVSEIKNVRRVAVVTHTLGNRTLSVIIGDLDGAS